MKMAQETTFFNEKSRNEDSDTKTNTMRNVSDTVNFQQLIDNSFKRFYTVNCLFA